MKTLILSWQEVESFFPFLNVFLNENLSGFETVRVFFSNIYWLLANWACVPAS